MDFPIWKINGPVGWWMEIIEVFLCLSVYMLCIEAIRDEWNENWIEMGKIQKIWNVALCMYPVDRAH